MGGRYSQESLLHQSTNAEAIRVSGLMESSEPHLRGPQPYKVNLHQIGQLRLSVCLSGENKSTLLLDLPVTTGSILITLTLLKREFKCMWLFVSHALFGFLAIPQYRADETVRRYKIFLRMS
jgi:hypothetical protein